MIWGHDTSQPQVFACTGLIPASLRVISHVTFHTLGGDLRKAVNIFTMSPNTKHLAYVLFVCEHRRCPSSHSSAMGSHPGSVPTKDEQKAHKYTCFARSALCTGNYYLYAPTMTKTISAANYHGRCSWIFCECIFLVPPCLSVSLSIIFCFPHNLLAGCHDFHKCFYNEEAHAAKNFKKIIVGPFSTNGKSTTIFTYHCAIFLRFSPALIWIGLRCPFPKTQWNKTPEALAKYEALWRLHLSES